MNHERLLCSEGSVLACNRGGWMYAERHRWARGGMGAVSAQIKLWVGGPIAIHHAGTYRARHARSLVETHIGWIVVNMLTVHYWSLRTEECSRWNSVLGHIKGVLINRLAAHVISWWSNAGLCDTLSSVFYQLGFWVTDWVGANATYLIHSWY